MTTPNDYQQRFVIAGQQGLEVFFKSISAEPRLETKATKTSPCSKTVAEVVLMAVSEIPHPSEQEMVEVMAEVMANGWEYGTHPMDKARIVLNAIRPFFPALVRSKREDTRTVRFAIGYAKLHLEQARYASNKAAHAEAIKLLGEALNLLPPAPAEGK